MCKFSRCCFSSNWNRFKRFHSLCLCNEEWKIKSFYINNLIFHSSLHKQSITNLAHLSLLKAIWSYFYAIFISVFLRIMLQFKLQSKQMSQQTKLCVVILTSSSAFNLASSSSAAFCCVSISACILVSSLASTATLIFRWRLFVKPWLASQSLANFITNS